MTDSEKIFFYLLFIVIKQHRLFLYRKNLRHYYEIKMEMNKLKTSQVKYKFTIMIYSSIQTQFVDSKFPEIEEKKKRIV